MPQDVYIYNPDVPVPKDVRYVEIPKGVTTVIGEDAFRSCPNLQSVTIPDDVTEIGNNAFQECSGLQSVTIPDGVTKIGSYAFWGCSALRSVTIPDSVTEIGDGAFSNCYSLQSVIIPDSVTEISVYAFATCTRLQSVTIPDSVTKIDDCAFSGCSGLRSVTIPDSVTEIGRSAFANCSGLQSVTMSNNVTKISEFTFSGCSDLRSVAIPDSVTEIWDYAFRRCNSLQSVTIPDGVTKIGDGAFLDCSGLQSVAIPDGVTKIGSSAFYDCSSLQSVTIPDSVTEISDGAFGGCSGLQSITIPDSVTKIGDYAFYGCSGLQSVTIPDSVTKIGDYAFDGCSALRTVTIPDSVTEIGEFAFNNCPGLRSVVIPDNVIKIRKCAFRYCNSLQSVTIPDSVTVIGKDAFAVYPPLQTLLYKDVNIAPFINIDGYGVNTFDVIKVLIEHQVPLSGHTVNRGIDMQHNGRLSEWARNYHLFGEMHIASAVRSADTEEREHLRQCFATQKKTGCHIPMILNELAIAAHICRIPSERLAETFDVRYTETLIRNRIPLVPAEVCRCYYDRGTCDMLIRKNKISVMADAISLYNGSEHQECYKHLMKFIRLHPDTRTEDLLYAVDHAEKIPMREGTTLTQIRQHRTYMESLAEVTKIEEEYGETVPGFKLSDYSCNIDPIGVTYDGMTARVLDLSDGKDIALAARLGDLTNCCQRLGSAGKTAMMHGFLNPDAGFWVIEDKDGKVKAQAEIWEADNGILVFDNIEFANTDSGHLSDRAEHLCGVIAVWAMESGYANIIMGCGYNELGTGAMEPAPIPELHLTPEEVFVLQEDNSEDICFEDIDEARRYMQTEEYDPYDFVYTDADEQCVYIKKDGIVSDYLMRGYDCTLTEKYPSSGDKTEKERGDEIA